MMGIHLPIALVEGVVTAAVVEYVRAWRPGIVGVGETAAQRPMNGAGGRETLVPLLISFLALAILTGGLLSQFASERPDGLEWAMARIEKNATVPQTAPVPALEQLQKKLALMPEYGFPRKEEPSQSSTAESQRSESARSGVRGGTSLAGLIGAALTLLLVSLVAGVLYWLRPHRKASS